MRQSLKQLQSAILRRFETPFLLSLVGKLWRKLDLVENAWERPEVGFIAR